MMIPDRIDRIELHDVSRPRGRTTAHVRPCPDPEGGTAFDADVVAEDGRMLLRVAGYRTVGLGGSVDRAISDGLNARLGNPRKVFEAGMR